MRTVPSLHSSLSVCRATTSYTTAAGSVSAVSTVSAVSAVNVQLEVVRSLSAAKPMAELKVNLHDIAYLYLSHVIHNELVVLRADPKQ